MPALQVRLSDDEYAKCKEAAKVAGVSMSEWVRSRLFDSESSHVPVPSKKPRPLPPRVPVNVDGVIVAPARKVPLPPVRRPSIVPAKGVVIDDALLPDLAVMPFDRQASPSGAKPLPVGELPIGDDHQPIAIPGPDVVSIGRDGKSFAAFSKPIPSPPDFDDDPLDSPEQTLEKVRDKAMDDLMEKSRPSTIGWTGAATSKPTFKRHPKCVTEKCERGIMGPACELCKQLNAKRF